MKKILMFVAAAFLAGLLAACQQNSPSGAMLSEAQRKTILAFTEPKVNNLMDGWNEEDYSVFSKDFNQDLLKSMTRDQFEKLKNDTLSGLGRFYSREVESVVQRSDGSYTVIYYSVFENDDEVLMRVRFAADDPHQISGLSFEK